MTGAAVEVKIGCDVVSIQEFQKSAARGGDGFLTRVFTPHELAGAPSLETLAGNFAMKEAVSKALELTIGDWHVIEVKRSPAGRPEVKVWGATQQILSHDVSVSHHGDYAIAVAVF